MTVRNITPTLANVLELLELEQPQLVSSEDLARYAREADVGWSTQLLVRRLRERGWLLDTGVRGVWEFVPAARAGAYGSGDRFSQIRAALHRDPGLPLAIASESAAFLLGYSSRVPAKEVVAVPRDVSVPPALRKGRVIRWDGPCKTAEVYGLPVWTVDTLLVAMSSRPSAYHDWPNVGEWLSVAARDANQDELRRGLQTQRRASWARMAHLLWRAGLEEQADQLIMDAPPGKGPFYLGRRQKDGAFDQRFDVIDSSGMEMTSW